MNIGQHRLAYEVLEGWERLPEGWSFVEVDASIYLAHFVWL